MKKKKNTKFPDQTNFFLNSFLLLIMAVVSLTGENILVKFLSNIAIHFVSSVSKNSYSFSYVPI